MELTVQKREKFGKATRALRRDGFIPAELYGHGKENLHLSVPVKEFKKAFKSAGENTLISLDIAGSGKRKVMIHEVQVHPVTEEFRNIDFYEVKLDEKIKVKVPLEFIGVSPAVKEKGGVLVKATQEIELEALPGSIPHSISADLSLIKDLNQSIYVRDLKLEGDAKILINADTVLATVKEKVEEEVAPVAEVTVDSVKVETEEKKAEREAKKQSETTAKEEKSKETKS